MARLLDVEKDGDVTSYVFNKLYKCMYSSLYYIYLFYVRYSDINMYVAGRAT